MPVKTKRPDLARIGMIVVTLLAFALRIYRLGARSLWYDELLQLDIAKGPLAEIGPQLIRHAGMPLDYYLLFGWIQLGRQDMWVRFPALFFGVLSIPLIYTLGRHFFSARVGFLAAILLMVSHFPISYSQEVRPYAVLLFLVMVAYLGLWQVYQTHQFRYWLQVLIGLGSAVLSHYFALFMLLPIGLFVAIHQLYHLKQKKFWQHTAYFGLCLMVLVLVLLVNDRLRFVYSVGYSFLPQIVTEPATLTLPASEKPNGGTGPPIEIDYLVDKIFVPLATNDPTTLLFYNLFFLIVILSLMYYRHKKRAAVLLLLGWIVFPIALIYLFLLYRGTFYAIRYILYTLPAYLILTAYGIDTLATFIISQLLNKVRWSPRNRAIAAKPLLISSFSFVVLVPLILAQVNQLTVYYAADSREDWRAVGQMLHDNASSNDAVIAVRAEPTINWYYPPAEAPYGTFGRSAPIWQAINQYQTRWFVLSSYSFRSDEGLRDWLKQQGAVTIAIDRRVVVHFHQEGLSIEEMLAQVKTFSLPQKALTYRVLADQFRQSGDLETSQLFNQKAVELTRDIPESDNQQTGWIQEIFGVFWKNLNIWLS